MEEKLGRPREMETSDLSLSSFLSPPLRRDILALMIEFEFSSSSTSASTKNLQTSIPSFVETAQDDSLVGRGGGPALPVLSLHGFPDGRRNGRRS